MEPQLGVYEDEGLGSFGCVQGSFEDLPPKLQQLLRELKAMARREGLGVEAHLKGACRARTIHLGVLPTDKFLSTLILLFHHYMFSQEALGAHATWYGCGDPSAASIAGREMVSWRAFLNDMMVANTEGVADPKRSWQLGAPAIGLFDESLYVR
eukprot:2138472-Prymnesium_polylepis.2